MTQAVGGGEQSGLVDGLLGLLSPADGQGGGLQGLVQTLKDRGLGDIVSSWVGTGQNLPISAEQLQGGLGANLIGQLASKAGISGEEASAKLAELLPMLVDKLTSDGQMPESGLLQQGLAMLRNSLPKG
jgi:uncharacterized protein YidB (DUF937 family)